MKIKRNKINNGENNQKGNDDLNKYYLNNYINDNKMIIIVFIYY